MTKKKKTKPTHIPRGQVKKGTVPKGQVPKGQVRKGTLPTGQIEIETPPEEKGLRMCPSCGNPMSYHGGVGSWYCQRCLRYFE